MRAIYLIARREYLSYVATWGFWISLASVPLFMLVGAAIPALVQSAQPVRHYVIIDETGEGLDTVIQGAIEAERRSQTRAALEAAAIVSADAATREQALAAFDADPVGLDGLDEALAILGMEDSAGMIASTSGNLVRVDAPARTIDELRPYLTGDQRVSTPDGPRDLFAAVFLAREAGEELPVINYYSANVTEQSLSSAVRRALRDHVREQALAARGLDPQEIRELSSLEPEMRNLNPATVDDSEVGAADLAPFIVAVVLAILLWTAIFSVANMLLTSLIEEKGGKIIELLLSTVRVRDLLIGKLLGVAAVSFTLFAVWGLIGTTLMLIAGTFLQGMDPEIAGFMGEAVQPGLFIAALGYFLVGYLMYGAIFLALGSLCETLQDAQSLMSPLILVLMLPLMILVFAMRSIDSVAVQIVSWVPIWTPFGMIARLPSEPPLWEIAGTTAVMVATLLLVVWGAASVFQQGALGHANADSVKRILSRKKPSKDEE
ncbi:MAG: ABC transporter permease [Caulobacterales bacterium]|uniref:ABC transporter permease n=1 Tax=Glycocaulis sp. TaxID=1969725 RepID=UPI003F9F1106